MTVRELIEHVWFRKRYVRLRCIAGHAGLDNVIGNLSINRPGLSLAGYKIDFVPDRIHMFGRGESGYLRLLEEENNDHSIEQFFKKGIPCVLFSYNITPPDFFLSLCERYHCPVIQSQLSSSAITQLVSQFISAVQLPSQIIHAVLVEVYGSGVLLTGESGIGKSETALALIERGHLLICDDAVRVTPSTNGDLIGRPAEPSLGYHMEIRGLGIINIPQLFGIGVVRERKVIDLLIELVDWDDSKDYDRITAGDQKVDILSVLIPKLTIPIRQGRNLTVIIETAVRHMRLKSAGYDAAEEFTKMVRENISKKTDKNNNKKNNKKGENATGTDASRPV